MLDTSEPRVVLGDLSVLQRAGVEIAGLAAFGESTKPCSAVFAATADLAYVLFTSGSTGKPKGVAMPSAPLRLLIDWHTKHPRLGQPARTLQFAPLSFDVHFQEIFSTFATGGTLVLIDEASRRDPERLLQAL